MKRVFRSFAPASMVVIAGWLGLASNAMAEAGRGDQPYRITTHFKFYGDKSVQPQLDKIAALAESHYAQLCGSLEACERNIGPIDVWLSDKAEALAARFSGTSPMSACAAGVAFLDEHRVILRAHPGALMTVLEAFDHELAHVLAQAHRTADGRPLPRWFGEGVATRLAGEGLVKRLEGALRAAPKVHLTYEELTAQFPEQGALVDVAYAQSALLVKRAVDEGGVDTVVGILKDTGRGVAFDEAFDKRFSMGPSDFFKRFEHDRTARTTSSSGTPWAVASLVSMVVAWWKLRGRKKQMKQREASEDAGPEPELEASSEDDDHPAELAEDAPAKP